MPTITTEALSNGTVGEFYCCGNLFASQREGVLDHDRLTQRGTPASPSGVAKVDGA